MTECVTVLKNYKKKRYKGKLSQSRMKLLCLVKQYGLLCGVLEKEQSHESIEILVPAIKLKTHPPQKREKDTRKI